MLSTLERKKYLKIANDTILALKDDGKDWKGVLPEKPAEKLIVLDTSFEVKGVEKKDRKERLEKLQRWLIKVFSNVVMEVAPTCLVLGLPKALNVLLMAKKDFLVNWLQRSTSSKG